MSAGNAPYQKAQESTGKRREKHKVRSIPESMGKAQGKKHKERPIPESIGKSTGKS
jgi:hypothetical protein